MGEVEAAAVQVVQEHLYALDPRWRHGSDDFVARVAARATQIAAELADYLAEWDVDDDEPDSPPWRPVVNVIDSL
jgi:hypothetical protein